MIKKAKVTLEVTAKITDEFIEFQSEAIGTAFGRWGYKKSDIEKALIEHEAYKGTAITPEQIRELKERNTAKAPIDADEDYGFFTCPSCGEAICTSDDFESHKFCLNCGQRIQWRE